MRIDYLCDHPELAPALADAHHAAFASLLPQWSRAEALAELLTHAARRAIPTTLLAIDAGGDWCGSVSLLANDDDRIRQYSPWLASLYVRPAARGTGVGRLLVRACESEAGALGVRALHLYCTPDLVPYYRALEWRLLDQLDLGGRTVRVMARDCTREQAA